MTLKSEYDLVIVGSGGGSMCAALVAHSLGKSVVILEKQSVVGGSTSFSGGVWWIPNHPLLARAGVTDSYQAGRDYLDAVVAHDGPAVTRERSDAFLKAGPAMIAFLEEQGMKLRRPHDTWPDYYDERPGGLAQGRSIMAEPFNVHELGEWEAKLSQYPPMMELPLGPDEFPTLFLMKRTTAGKLKTLKYAAKAIADKLTGRQTVTNGAAIQGRMLQIALKADLAPLPDTPVHDFIVEGGRVVGVRATHDGKPVEVRARGGVLVNSGGFSRNAAFREKHARQPSSADWTSANPGDTGEVLQAMMDLGAATDCLDTAWWVVTSRNTNGDWPLGAVWKDGRILPFMHHLDLSLPFSIMVDQDGRRIADESGAYMEIGERLYQRQEETGRAIPAWMIFDARHRARYPWGAQAPGVTPREWLETGYMKKADTLEELAVLCGVDQGGLKAEVDRYNAMCKTGIDTDFGRGGRAFDRAHGDPTVTPNPNMGPIEQGPFHACAIYPGDVGTAGGVVTDPYARVVRADGSVIEGLYATGNCTASVFGRTYPGAGASIGASFTFGFIAAHHAAGSNELNRLLAE